MSTQGKGKAQLKKPSQKRVKVKKDPKPIETAFTKALADRLKNEPRMFAMSDLRDTMRGSRDTDVDDVPKKRRRGTFMITTPASKMANSEIAGYLTRITREALVYCRKKRSPNNSRFYVSIDPGPIAFGAISLGVLPEPMSFLPYIPGALEEKEEEEIRLNYVKFSKEAEKEKKKKAQKKANKSSPSPSKVSKKPKASKTPTRRKKSAKV